MLKFTYIFNFSLAGALIIPSVTQELGSMEQLEHSIVRTEQALNALVQVEQSLQAGEYKAVELIMKATEAPFGAPRERSLLLDSLRHEIGELEARVELIDTPPALEHLRHDPTTELQVDPSGMEHSTSPGAVSTTGLSEAGRTELGSIWPPVPGTSVSGEPSAGARHTFEKPGFTVDAVRQGRAYYRAGRYNEALTLLKTRESEPEAGYWIGRCYEHLDRSRDALAAYRTVISHPESGAWADRAKADLESLEWLIDFDRKIKDLRGPEGVRK